MIHYIYLDENLHHSVVSKYYVSIIESIIIKEKDVFYNNSMTAYFF